MVIEKLNEKCVAAAFELITLEFLEHNIIHKALGTQLDDCEYWFFTEFQNTLEEGLSLVGFDPVTENLIGVLFATDLMKPTNFEARKPLSVQSPLRVSCADLKRRYLQLYPRNTGEALLLDMVAVSWSYRGQGIYRAIRLEINNVALRHQYKYVVGGLSSAITQKILFNEMGHSPVLEIRYQIFLHRVEYPFASKEYQNL